MKKYLVCILIISMFILCSCKTNISTISDDQQASALSMVETNQNNSENESKINDVDDGLKNQKTVINVDSKSAKMSFVGSNDNISTVEKEYLLDKVSAFEKYTKENMPNKNFNVLGVEYKDVPYYQSERNSYTDEDYDEFKNDKVEFHISKNGMVTFFSCNEPLKVFSDENKQSEELAKKYLEIILPDYKYDIVRKYQIDAIDKYTYQFFKTINGVRTSDGVSISLNSNGELKSYIIHDIGKYDNIEIKDFNIDDFLKRVDEYVKEGYNKSLVDYSLSDDGPFLKVFTDDKLELNIPIVINVKSEEGKEYKFREQVVFELN